MTKTLREWQHVYELNGKKQEENDFLYFLLQILIHHYVAPSLEIYQNNFRSA